MQLPFVLFFFVFGFFQGKKLDESGHNPVLRYLFDLDMQAVDRELGSFAVSGDRCEAAEYKS